MNHVHIYEGHTEIRRINILKVFELFQQWVDCVETGEKREDISWLCHNSVLTINQFIIIIIIINCNNRK